jgi:CelD/BcsL family acetyltransferase involved in cellulose biosynthesis
MRVTVIDDVSGLGALRERWQEVLREADPNHVFMTWEWCFSWWKYFGGEGGRRLFVMVVEDGGDVVGLAPLMLFIDHRGGGCKVRYLHFMGFRFKQRWNDWMDVIAVRREAALRAIMEYLAERQHLWDYLDLWDLAADSGTIEILEGIAPDHGFSIEEKTLKITCPYMPTVSDWEGYYRSQRSKQVSGDPERQVRRLRATGDLKVEFADETSDLMASLDALFDLNERQRTVRKQPAMFADARYREFYRELARVFPRNWLDCSVLRLNGTAIAVHFGFRYNRKLYFCTPAFDPDYMSFGPGKVLLRYLVEDCFADENIGEFDFLAGREPYKYEWATAERHSYRLRIANAHASGLVGKMLRRVPVSVRRSVIAASSVL